MADRSILAVSIVREAVPYRNGQLYRPIDIMAGRINCVKLQDYLKLIWNIEHAARIK